MASQSAAVSSQDCSLECLPTVLCRQVEKGLTRAHCSSPADSRAPLCISPLLMPLHAQEGMVLSEERSLQREGADIEGEL